MEAIFVRPNNALKVTEAPYCGVSVRKGPVNDGIGKYLQNTVPVDNSPDIREVLEETNADVLIITVPVGSDNGAKLSSKSAFEAGVGLINGMPALIANGPAYVQLAEWAGVTLIGDDIKSQVGATIVHRGLVSFWLTGEPRFAIRGS